MKICWFTVLVPFSIEEQAIAVSGEKFSCLSKAKFWMAYLLVATGEADTILRILELELLWMCHVMRLLL